MTEKKDTQTKEEKEESSSRNSHTGGEESTKNERNAEKGANPYLIPISIIIAGLLIAGGIYFGSSKSQVNPNPVALQGAGIQPDVHIEDVNLQGDPFIGEKDAPVTMAYWFDYQCPFCHQFETQTMSQIVKDYVKTGKVKIVFQDFQFLGPDSQAAALVARAVWEVAPDQFYQWYQAIFSHQDAENSGWGSREDVLAVTKEVLGAQTAGKVEALSEKNKEAYLQAIAADRKEGAKFGISGTPGMIIGDQLIVGAESYARVKQAIEAALSQ